MVRAFLDTNVPVRHLTGQPLDQARRATEMLAGEHQLIVTDLILAEVVYVLESFGGSRHDVAIAVRSMLALPAVAAPSLNLMLRSVELYELERLQFADAYVVAAAELSGVRKVASFDRGLDRVRSITRIEP